MLGSASHDDDDDSIDCLSWSRDASFSLMQLRQRCVGARTPAVVDRRFLLPVLRVSTNLATLSAAWFVMFVCALNDTAIRWRSRFNQNMINKIQNDDAIR